ncbi:unnamed protein product [Prorocentrum cordatum]|uniref:Transmembrane protein 107 n=1 Tax=Prorocentrum cordatum TaxID=2364126 RepID=A0ABN9UKL0_9DINO|nr:unnamed protein product [Polarella glacialis]
MDATSCALYAHTAIECVAGSLLLYRGMSSSDKVQDCTGRMYRRWHGAGLLSLSFLGYEAIRSHNDGKDISTALRVCTMFHGLAAAIMFFARADVKDNEKAAVTLKVAMLNPHNFLALAFAYVAAK